MFLVPTLLVPCLLFGSPPPLRHVSTAHRSLPLRGCAVKPGEDPELLAKVDFDRQRALLSERAAAYQSLPVVSTLVLGFSCNQLTAFAESDPNTLALLAADAAVALVLLAIASSLYATVVFVLEFYYIKRLCGTAMPNLKSGDGGDLYETLLAVSDATYELRQLGRNALWAGLICLVLSTGMHFLATIEGLLGPFALSACALSAVSVPFVVARFRELYLPIVSPKRYAGDLGKD